MEMKSEKEIKEKLAQIKKVIEAGKIELIGEFTISTQKLKQLIIKQEVLEWVLQ